MPASPKSADGPRDTNALLAAAQDGDRRALEELLSVVQPQLYRFSMKMCRHDEDAEDVLQESLIAIARSIRDFRGASSLSTWLYTVARSHCIKKRRKSKFAPEHLERVDDVDPGIHEGLVSAAPDPFEVAASAETWRLVQVAIQQLSPEFREVLVLRDIEGLTAPEVAEVVGISVGAVKSRLHRARADLRDHLRDRPYRPRDGCPDIRAVFSQFLESELSPEICSTMEAHVAGCSLCAAECNGLRTALNACSSAPCDVPLEVQKRVHEALRKSMQSLP